MPDAQGRFKGMAVPAEAWERIFGKSREQQIEEYLDALKTELDRLRDKDDDEA